MRTLINLLILFSILSCTEQPSGSKTAVKKITIRNNTIYKYQNNNNQDSVDFLAAVIGLEDIHFYIEGKDSIFVTNNPNELIELNTTKNAFHTPFSKSDTGLVKYQTIDLIRKYKVKRKDGIEGNRPSANIIQLTFSDNYEAAEWFGIYDRSPLKGIIQSKPKTELWLDSHHVYFIQTYHTPQRDYVELLKKSIIENIKTNKK